MIKFKILLLLLMLCLLPQCASNPPMMTLRPNYEPNLVQPNALISLQPAIKFKRGQFSDKRVTETISVFVAREASTDNYEFYPEQPVEEVIFDGLETLFSGSGHRWSELGQANVRVDVQLLNIQCRNAKIMPIGAWADSRTQVKLNFVDIETDDLIYTQIYNGVDERDKGVTLTEFSRVVEAMTFGGSAGLSDDDLLNLVEVSVNASLIDCVNNIGSDEDLVKALEKLKSE